MIERWLAELERELRVHGRRRKRVVEELAGHLHEAAVTDGEAGAVSRMGDPGEVARSFTPRLLDRVFEQRDRLAALTMLLRSPSSEIGSRAGRRAATGDRRHGPRPAHSSSPSASRLAHLERALVAAPAPSCRKPGVVQAPFRG